MKNITLICAILLAMTALFSAYNLTVGSYPIVDDFLESPVYAVESMLWFLTDIAMSAFFFVLWTNQD